MINQLIDLGPYQWIGLLFGLFYIIYAIKNKPICWVFGIVSCSSIAWEDFHTTKLYSDGILQIFYVIMGFVGLYKWNRGGQGSSEKVSELSLFQHLIILLTGLLISGIMGKIIEYYTDAAFPYLDGLTSIFSVVATLLLVYRKLSNWIYWILIDAIYVYLYYDRYAPLFALLYVIFTVLAIVGLHQWRKEYEIQSKQSRILMQAESSNSTN